MKDERGKSMGTRKAFQVKKGLTEKQKKLRKKTLEWQKKNAKRRGLSQEVGNTLFCPSDDKFHAVVLKGVRNISVNLLNSPMSFI